jgi:ribokinase
VILVFGSINLDLVARVPCLPRPGETLAGESFATFPGGKGANQALAARRAGASVALAGAVGTDAFAAPALATLEAGGVDLAAVRRVDAPTGVALVQVDASGENCITIVAGANAHVDPTAVPAGLLASATMLLLQLEVPLAAIGAIVARAKDRGMRIVLNAAPALAVPAALLSSLDVLIVNEGEAASLAAILEEPAAPEAFATSVFRRCRCATVVTLGSRGALAATADGVLRVEAPAVEVIDTTGAGDALVGAIAAALDRGESWPRALAEGVAAGSLACTSAGAQPSLPTAAGIRRLAAQMEATRDRISQK